MLRGALAVGVWTVWVAAFGLAACGGAGASEDCATYCEIRSACCASSPDLCRDNDDIPTCTSTCRALAEDDPAYASAIADKAACFEEVENEENFCNQVVFGCPADGT